MFIIARKYLFCSAGSKTNVFGKVRVQVEGTRRVLVMQCIWPKIGSRTRISGLPALPEPSIFDPSYWGDGLEHYIADEFPSGEEVARAVAADRQLIQQWIKMHGRKTCQ